MTVEPTFETQLREWFAKGWIKNNAEISVTEYGVSLYFQPEHRYPTRAFSVNGNEVTALTIPVPPKGE